MDQARGFDFEAFDKLCREVLEDYDAKDVQMVAEDIEREYDRLPGEIGGVACSPSFGLTDPPEAS